VRGLTYSKNDEVEFSKNAVLRATNIDLSSNKLNLTELRYIDDSVHVRDDKKVKVNDILMCTASGSKSHLGKVALIDKDLDMAFGGFMGVLRVKPNTNAKYLFNFLKSDLFLNHVFNLGDGANINNLKFSQIEDLELSLPPIEIQEQIIKRLDAVLNEIDKATTASETNAENAKRYLGKLIDEIIHHGLEKYTELTLNEITEVITCGVAKRPEYVESGVPFLSARNVKNGKMKWDRYEFVSKETHNTLSKYNKPKIGDILYSRVGAGFGDAAIIDKDIEFSIFVSLTLLKVKPVVNNEFLCYYLNSPFIKEVARKNITGTGVGNLNVGAVRQFKIKLPTLEAQREIVKKLDSISQNGRILIDSYNKKLKELSLLKQSILIQAFNGELIKE
jgi:type I restriction enzyme S subunit